jgi:pyruvate,orthophosphate dikinase
VIAGQLKTLEAQPDDKDLVKFMSWVDPLRRLKIRANADIPRDAKQARLFGAEGIGLCRTEHMFFAEDRIGHMRTMILADNEKDRRAALKKLLPMQRADFIGLLKAMESLPVTIRLLDPPLHEFLPKREELLLEIAHLEDRNPKLSSQFHWPDADSDPLITRRMKKPAVHHLTKKETEAQERLTELRRVLARVEELHEQNPMLGLRGCRLGITFPEITEMQVRAIIEAAVAAKVKGGDPHVEIMVPLIGSIEEMRNQTSIVRRVAEDVFKEKGSKVNYMVGTMIELPRAALTADQIAEEAEFFSFGTNDLTQTTFGISRDDINNFLPAYMKAGIFKQDPFATLDQAGVGQLVKMATTKGRNTRPNLKLGICGEHGGDPDSVKFCHKIGLNYVSCSPFRLLTARLAAAQAAVEEKQTGTVHTTS